MSYANLRYRHLSDWVRLRPLLWLYKLARRRVIGWAYVSKPAVDPAALARLRDRLRGKPVAVTVTFNSVWLLEWQIKFGLRHIVGMQRLFADNSSDPVMAEKIANLCSDHDIAYVRLPFNRFSLGRPKDPSLSHAAALNWVWRHVITPSDCPIVAILDHDLIALRPVDLTSKVASQPIFGPLMVGAHYGWQVWPGYAVFDRRSLQDARFDFWVDPHAGLDTGGANWRRIYRRLDQTALNFPVVPPHIIGRFDEWWHVGNASEYAEQPEGWRERVIETLQSEYVGTDQAAGELSSNAP